MKNNHAMLIDNHLKSKWIKWDTIMQVELQPRKVQQTDGHNSNIPGLSSLK